MAEYLSHPVILTGVLEHLDPENLPALARAHPYLRKSVEVPRGIRKNIPNYCAVNGFASLLELYISDNGPASFACQHLAILAVENGHASVLGPLLAADPMLVPEVSRYAAYCGRVEVLVWLKNHRRPWKNNRTAIAAIQGGQLRVLNWLRANGLEPGPVLTRAARASNNPQIQNFVARWSAANPARAWGFRL